MEKETLMCLQCGNTERFEKDYNDERCDLVDGQEELVEELAGGSSVHVETRCHRCQSTSVVTEITTTEGAEA